MPRTKKETVKKESKVKKYVLDTNVIMADPDCFYKFEENHVFIPDAVIEELDNHKKDPNDVGYNVRKASRTLDALSYDGKSEIPIGSNGGTLTFLSELSFEGFPESWDRNKNDNRILAAARSIPDAILISRDTNMRIKARILGMPAQNYRHEMVEDDYLTYKGRTNACTDKETFECFSRMEPINISLLKTEGENLKENEFVIVKPEGEEKELVGIIKAGKLEQLRHMSERPMNICPRNLSQYLAVEALLAPADEIPLVILSGAAGTAKTFLTLACGLEQVLHERRYRRLIISRANIEFDRDIGALPGTEEEKVEPLLRGCMDNLEQLLCQNGPEDETEDYGNQLWYVFDKKWIKAEALGFLRGRSITNQILFIDEAQNTTVSQMNGILTRIGEGSKVVIAGDLTQIDNPRLDRHNNGLAHAIKLMAGDTDCCIVSFSNEESTRSRLAKKVAAKIEVN